MIFTIVIALVIALIVLAILINAVQQHKEKVEAEKRTELAKHKNTVEETEELLMNISNYPVSQQLILILHQRLLDAIKAMSELAPDSNELKTRLKDTQQRVKNISPQDQQNYSDDSFTLPDDERATISLIQGIKKLRSALRSEHTKGKVDTQIFMLEDKRLDALQLKINVESLMKRGHAARQTQMLGSARQYYEKALATIDGQATRTDYANQRKADLTKLLSDITEDLKNSNAQDRRKKAAEEEDDLDVLFQPKKKW